jgi:hypothetical protein
MTTTTTRMGAVVVVPFFTGKDHCRQEDAENMYYGTKPFLNGMNPFKRIGS